MDSFYDVITFISKKLYFKKVWGSFFFAGIINIGTILLRQSLKTQEKLKELEIMKQIEI